LLDGEKTMTRILTAAILIALCRSANAQQALTPQWDTRAQHERMTTAISRPEYSNCCMSGECWFERGSTCHSNRAERDSQLARCMVDLSTITDPELRRWCEAQSKRLP
jgi:hypothetical protein